MRKEFFRVRPPTCERFIQSRGGKTRPDLVAQRQAESIWLIKCSTSRNDQMTHSATVQDPLIEAPGANAAGWHAGVERRRSPRATLHWTLYLRCSGSENPLRTEVSNISRHGFYCLLNQPITPGERINCDIVVPTHSSGDPDDVVYLRCSAQAVRVEKVLSGAEFGLACRVDDYCVIHGHPKVQGSTTAANLRSAAAL